STQGRVQSQGLRSSRLETADPLRAGRRAVHQVGRGKHGVRAPKQGLGRAGWRACCEPPGVNAAAMTYPWSALLLIPVVISCVYWIPTIIVMLRFFRDRPPDGAGWIPAVSLIKPVCGLEKNLYENLSTACQQEYPEYEVIFSLQDPADRALPLLARIREENPTVPVRLILAPPC